MFTNKRNTCFIKLKKSSPIITWEGFRIIKSLLFKGIRVALMLTSGVLSRIKYLREHPNLTVQA